LADLVKEKGISEEAFIETLKNALASAYKKQYEADRPVPQKTPCLPLYSLS